MSALNELFRNTKSNVPEALSNWDECVDAWCLEYMTRNSNADISMISFDHSVFLFDHGAERVVLAYALSVEQLLERDSSRISGFPTVNASNKTTEIYEMTSFDKGHFLGHASGGNLDINLFPHRRELNRGWSDEGKRFRAMERHVAKHHGTFFYHRPTYDDKTWIPHFLEYGVLVDNKEWWIDMFKNK